MARLTDWGPCTVQIRGGAFCDAPSMPDAPFPICQRHAQQLAMFMAAEVVAMARLK